MSIEPSHTDAGSVHAAPANAAEAVASFAGAQETSRKEFLPRRSGESRFAPPQYFYPASKSGGLPVAANSSTLPPTAMQPAA